MNTKFKIFKYLNSGKILLYVATFFVAENLFASQALAAGANRISVSLVNPLKVKTIEDLFEALLSVVIVLATPIIVFFIIYSGFLYVTARGNAEQVKQATAALTYAVIGGVIILGAVAIATIVKNLVTSF